MKSIYQKITLILFIGFAIQIILIGTFYRQVIVRQIISEINNQENKRQIILQEAMDAVQKYPNRPERAEKTLNQYSNKYNVNFEIKDTEGNTIFSTNHAMVNQNIIQEQGYVRTAGKVSYIVYGSFPAKLTNVDVNIGQKRFRILITICILMLATITLFWLYRILANPLKKLEKAINSLNYGSTLTKIPYYGDDEFGLLCRSFEEMGMRLKKSEDSQQELVQAISHDIKTPLTSIIGYSKRLIEAKVDEERKNEYYEIIFRKANDLKSIAEELEDYGNFNQEGNYNKVQLNANEYLVKLSENIRAEVEHKGGKLEFINSLNDSTRINIDDNRIKRVFWNVIENSRKYTGEKCSIRIECSRQKNMAVIEICDNGSGVSEEQLERIFDRFYRLDTSRSREKGGTGLGLAICKDIIEKHGGHIGARNVEPKGLCIWFTLPLIL